MDFPFTKMQGVGNDFVVVDEGAWRAGADWPAQAIRLCDRKRGVGADGLLVVGPSTRVDLRMRMFNPDGTEDMCGNGLRCVVRFAHARGTIGDEAVVETHAGFLSVAVLPGGLIRTAMGPPALVPVILPMNVPGERVLDFPLPVAGDTIPVSVISTGTTHAIVFVSELPGDERFFALSPLIENHELFPERTSVMWTQVTGPNHLRLRIWERGAGETLGCGTGACAAAVLARVQGKVAAAGEVMVASKGGELHVDWFGDEGSAILLTGPAETVYTGVWPG